MAESTVIEYVGGKRGPEGNLREPGDLCPLKDAADEGLHMLLKRELSESDEIKLDGDVSVRIRGDADADDVAALLYMVFRHWFNTKSSGLESGRGPDSLQHEWDREMRSAGMFQ